MERVVVLAVAALGVVALEVARELAAVLAALEVARPVAPVREPDPAVEVEARGQVLGLRLRGRPVAADFLVASLVARQVGHREEHQAVLQGG